MGRFQHILYIHYWSSLSLHIQITLYVISPCFFFKFQIHTPSTSFTGLISPRRRKELCSTRHQRAYLSSEVGNNIWRRNIEVGRLFKLNLVFLLWSSFFFLFPSPLSLLLIIFLPSFPPHSLIFLIIPFFLWFHLMWCAI